MEPNIVLIILAIVGVMFVLTISGGVVVGIYMLATRKERARKKAEKANQETANTEEIEEDDN